LPRDIDGCPVSKIIDFRARYAGERARFNESVTRLITESEELTDIRDEHVLLDHLKASYDNQLGPALRDLERAMRGARIDTVTGAMNVQAAVPAAVASSLALLALHPSAAQAAAIGFGGLALGVWTSARRAAGTRGTALASSPVSYLYHLRHDLQPLDLAERLRQATAQFSPPKPATPGGDSARGRSWLRSDNKRVLIRKAREDELAAVQALDRDAGQVFGEIGMPEVAQYDPWPLEDLAASQQAGRLWVAAEEADVPVAFLMASVVDGCLHVEQLSTDPGNARRGLGRALLEHAAGRAAAEGLPALTLTTFEHVPWNAPYYARCGFRVLSAAEITPGLRAIRRHEAALGLDRWPRVCMRRDVRLST
jgi:GNAT superfamily N-acetyltransferase